MKLFNKVKNINFREKTKEKTKEILSVTSNGYNILAGYLETTLEKAKTKEGALKLYEKMQHDDSISAVKQIINQSIAALGYDYINKDEKINEFVKYNFENLKDISTGIQLITINNLIENIGEGEWNGHQIGEIVWGSSRKGKTTIKSIKCKPSNNLEFKIDKVGNLETITQTGLDDNIIIKAEEMYGNYFLYIHPYLKNGNYTGTSKLDSTYREWRTKDIFIKFFAIAVERLADPIKIGYVKANQKKLKEHAQKVIKDKIKNILVETNENEKGVLSKPFELDLKELSLSGLMAYERAIDRFDTAIKRALLFPDDLGLTSVKYGSRSKAETTFNIFFANVVAIAKAREDIINKQIIKPLIEKNFNDIKDFTVFKICTDVKQFSESSAKIISTLIDKQIIKLKYFEDEDWEWLRQYTGYPIIKNYFDKQEEQEKEKEEKPDTETEEEQKDIEQKIQTNIMNILPVEKNVKFNKIQPYDKTTKYNQIENYLDKSEMRGRLEVQEIIKKIENELQKEMLSKKEATSISDFKLRISGDRTGELKSVYLDLLIKTYFYGIEQNKNEIEGKTGELKSYFDEWRPSELQAIENKDVNKWVREWSKQHGVRLSPEMKIAFSRIKDSAFTIAGVFSTTIEDKVKNIVVSNIDRMAVSDIVKMIQRDVFNPNLFTPAQDGRAPADWQLKKNIRTNMSREFNNGRMDLSVSEDFHGVVSAYMYSAIMDSATTVYCQGHHGDIVQASDIKSIQFNPPNHFQCRSLLTVITSNESYKTRWTNKWDDQDIELPAKGFGV